MGSSHRSPPLLLRLQPLLLLLLLLLLGHVSSAHQASSLSSPSSPSSSLLAALQEDIAAEEREEAVLGCIENNIELALIQASITREKIDDFKDDYTKAKYNMTFEDWSNSFPSEMDEAVMEVCTVDQECSTVLPSLPPATDSDAAKALEEILSYFLRFMFAYQQLVLDQAMKEDKFAKEMHDAYINSDQLARLLENVLEACGLPGDFSDIATLHGKMHISTKDPRTDLRGFSTLRQSLRGLDLLDSTFGQRFRKLEEKAEIKEAVERLVERAVEEVEDEKAVIDEEAVERIEQIREEMEDDKAVIEEEAVERLLTMAAEEVENVMAEEQRKEEAVQRRNKKGKKKGKGGRGRSSENRKNKNGKNKRRKRRRDYLD